MLYSLLKEFNNKKTKHTDKASSPYFSVIKKKLACYKKLPLMKSHQTSYTQQEPPLNDVASQNW
jgi:hypothetical protein